MDAKEAREFTEGLIEAAAGHEQTRQGLVRIAAHGIGQGVPKLLNMGDAEWAESIGRVALTVQSGRRELVAELTEEGMSTRQIGAAVGASKDTVRNDLATGEDSPADQDEVPDNADLDEATGEDSPVGWVGELEPDEDELEEPDSEPTPEELAAEAKKKRKEEAAEETRRKRETSRAAPELADAFELRIGDAREVLANVPDSSVPLVLTDPPYGDEAEPLYEWLAEWSARVLIPGGSLIVYTGQSRLDRDMRIFSDQLRYWWLFSMMHTRAQQLPGKFVRAGFKPVLWYVKDHRRGRELVDDVLRPPAAAINKDDHKWGQGEGGVTLLIEKLTSPGERILDPFAGTAEWGRIAESMGRRWLGADVVADVDERKNGLVAA